MRGVKNVVEEGKGKNMGKRRDICWLDFYVFHSWNEIKMFLGCL
jgi:hypothetical protein